MINIMSNSHVLLCFNVSFHLKAMRENFMIKLQFILLAVVHVKYALVSLAQEAGKTASGCRCFIDAQKNSKQKRRHLKSMTLHVE